MDERQNIDGAERGLLERNIRLFFVFRILFNARFYYPVFAILFLDIGLSLEEFAIVNVVWAIAIVTLEVPSGALADRIGRRNMVVLAGIFMVVEIALITLVPIGNHTIVFVAIVINRILSGAAEASASGADEALAYDSLCLLGRKGEWPRIIESLMKMQSGAFFFSSILGAAVYDPALVNRVLSWMGLPGDLVQETTLRFPLVLTLCTAIGVLVTSLLFHEPPSGQGDAKTASVRETWNQILVAGKWILSTPVALLVICAGFLYDSFVRLFLTLQSSYFRLIDIPESAFGVLGSAFAVLGFLTAPLGKMLVGKFPLGRNLTIPAVLILVGLVGIALAIPYWGVLFVVPLGVAFFLITFFQSHYLNDMVDSSKRATVLSFKGLSLNLAYGIAGLVFSGLIAWIKTERDFSDAADPETAAFGVALPWLPPIFIVLAAALMLYGWRATRDK